MNVNWENRARQLQPYFFRPRGAGTWQLLFLLRETAITYYNYDVYTLWNPSGTGSKRVRRLQGSNTPVPVAFRISESIRNGASPQTHTLKPNRWCCWEFTLCFFSYGKPAYASRSKTGSACRCTNHRCKSRDALLPLRYTKVLSLRWL